MNVNFGPTASLPNGRRAYTREDLNRISLPEKDIFPQHQRPCRIVDHCVAVVDIVAIRSSDTLILLIIQKEGRINMPCGQRPRSEDRAADRAPLSRGYIHT